MIDALYILENENVIVSPTAFLSQWNLIQYKKLRQLAQIQT